MLVTRKVIESSTEDKIVIGCVMSNRFLREISPVYDHDYLLNSFAKTICAWCLDYYETYEKAPRYSIRDIFDSEKETLEASEITIIEAFLKKLSKLYSEEEEINEDYFIDKAMEYFKKRELELVNERVKKLLDNGKTIEAEQEYEKLRKIEKQTSSWYSWFSQKEFADSFNDKNEQVLHMSGEFGRFIGPLERGWLISVVGGFKLGKTWMMQEIIFQALTERVKVATISLEMKKSTRNKRGYRKMSSLPDAEGEVMFPCFDCKSNQENTCELEERVNRYPLSDDGSFPIYTSDMIYKPCCVCRAKRIKPKEFKLTTWFDSMIKPEFSMKNAAKSMNSFKKMWGDNIKLISYPRFSKTLGDIRRDLDLLEYLEGFVPDIIVIDYAGIVKPERTFIKDYMALDTIWKGLSELSEERHALVVTGSQLERGSLKKDAGDADVAGLAGWIGQAADVDLEFVLNQTPEEKARGVIRLNKLVDRNNDFNVKDTCYVLQHLGIGQAIIDSEIVREYGYSH